MSTIGKVVLNGLRVSPELVAYAKNDWKLAPNYIYLNQNTAERLIEYNWLELAHKSIAGLPGPLLCFSIQDMFVRIDNSLHRRGWQDLSMVGRIVKPDYLKRSYLRLSCTCLKSQV